MARAIKITSVSGALTVTITGPNGGTPVVYADSSFVNVQTMPATVADTATTTFWLQGPGKYTLSVKTSGGTEIAADNNSTRTVDVETDGTVAALNYDARTLATVSGDSGHSTAGSAASGLTDQGAWVTSHAYLPGDAVTQSGLRYACKTGHTSGTFATDLAAGDWTLLGVAALSNATPQVIGAASAGTAVDTSRSDHTHSDALSTAGFKTGLYYPTNGASTNGAQTQTLNTAYATPFIVTKASSFDQIAANIAVTVATATCRLGVYADTGSRYPGALLLDAGTLDASAFSPNTIAISLALTPGLYWLVGASQGSAASKMACWPGSLPFNNIVAFNNVGSYTSNVASGYSQASVSGALPGTWTSTVTTVGLNGAVAVWLRAA